MRFRLTLESSCQQEVPVNYQHLDSSWIYRVFGRADKEFSSWLHKRGYEFEGKRRKKWKKYQPIMGLISFHKMEQAFLSKGVICLKKKIERVKKEDIFNFNFQYNLKPDWVTFESEIDLSQFLKL